MSEIEKAKFILEYTEVICFVGVLIASFEVAIFFCRRRKKKENR